MTEYDYSPEAYQRHLETQHRISKWVDNTERHSHEFRPAVPARSESSDSIVTVKEPHRSSMPYNYYRSGPPPGMPLAPPMPSSPPPPPGMTYAPYPGPMPLTYPAAPPPPPPPPPPAPIIYQPTPQPPLYVKQPSSSRKLRSHKSSSSKRTTYTIIQPTSPPASPLSSPPPGAFQPFAPGAPPVYRQYRLMQPRGGNVKVFYV